MRPSSKLIEINMTTITDEQNNPLPWELVARLYEKAGNSYDFRLLDSHGVLFRASQDEEDLRAYDGGLGWENLFAKGLEIISVTGNHLTMVRQESHTLTLARKMTEVLRRYSMSKGNTLGI